MKNIRIEKHRNFENQRKSFQKNPKKCFLNFFLKVEKNLS